jgi:hypothetical protein
MRAAVAGALGLALLGVTAGSVAAQSSDMSGRHSMQGKITRVDSKDGWVHVKTPEGTLIVHVPPQELQTAKKGDAVTLELALKNNGPAKK